MRAVKDGLPVPYGEGKESERPRSTAAMGPARGHSRGVRYEQAWREHYGKVLVRRAQWRSFHRPFYVREKTYSPHTSEWVFDHSSASRKITPLKDLALELGSPNCTV